MCYAGEDSEYVKKQIHSYFALLGAKKWEEIVPELLKKFNLSPWPRTSREDLRKKIAEHFHLKESAPWDEIAEVCNLSFSTPETD